MTDKFSGVDKTIPFDDDLSHLDGDDELLPWEDEVEADEDDSLLDDLDEDFDEPVGDAFLSFLDPDADIPQEVIESQVSEALEQFTFEELLEENEMSEIEALGILYELGFIGLPEFILEDDNEEIQDREEGVEED